MSQFNLFAFTLPNNGPAQYFETLLDKHNFSLTAAIPFLTYAAIQRKESPVPSELLASLAPNVRDRIWKGQRLAIVMIDVKIPEEEEAVLRSIRMLTLDPRFISVQGLKTKEWANTIAAVLRTYSNQFAVAGSVPRSSTIDKLVKKMLLQDNHDPAAAPEAPAADAEAPAADAEATAADAEAPAADAEAPAAAPEAPTAATEAPTAATEAPTAADAEWNQADTEPDVPVAHSKRQRETESDTETEADENAFVAKRTNAPEARERVAFELKAPTSRPSAPAVDAVKVPMPWHEPPVAPAPPGRKILSLIDILAPAHVSAFEKPGAQEVALSRIQYINRFGEVALCLRVFFSVLSVNNFVSSGLRQLEHTIQRVFPAAKMEIKPTFHGQTSAWMRIPLILSTRVVEVIQAINNQIQHLGMFGTSVHYSIVPAE